jgi:hypothetical protein
MNCEIVRSIYLRSNSEIACYDDAGGQIVLGRRSRTGELTDVDAILNHGPYKHVRDSLKNGKLPWPGTCNRCALFREKQPFLDTLLEKRIRTLQVEPTLACALACPACFQKYEIKLRDKPLKMKVSVFEAALKSFNQAGYKIDIIEYCGNGEPLNNPEFSQFAQVARDVYPTARQRLITNGNFDYNRSIGGVFIDEILVSRDGVHQSGYGKYRINGRVDVVEKFMRDIPREAHGRRQLKIWKYILFEFNDSDEEIIEAQRRVTDLGFDGLMFVFTQTIHRSVRFTEQTAKDIPINSTRAFVSSVPGLDKARHTREITGNAIVHRLESVPVVHAPTWSESRSILSVLDTFSLLDGAECEVRGWALSKSTIDRIEFRHNGTEVGTTKTEGRRWDVFVAWPDFGDPNSGYQHRWPLVGAVTKEHQLEVTVHTKSGENCIYRFSRSFG